MEEALLVGPCRVYTGPTPSSISNLFFTLFGFRRPTHRVTFSMRQDMNHPGNKILMCLKLGRIWCLLCKGPLSKTFLRAAAPADWWVRGYRVNLMLVAEWVSARSLVTQLILGLWIKRSIELRYNCVCLADWDQGKKFAGVKLELWECGLLEIGISDEILWWGNADHPVPSCPNNYILNSCP